MSGTEQDVERAHEEARRARARLAHTMGEILERLSPRTLLNEAWDEVRERGQEMAGQAVNLARSKPVATSAVAAAGIALLAREPIWRALSKLIFHRRETPPADEGLKPLDDPAPPGSGEISTGYKEVA